MIALITLIILIILIGLLCYGGERLGGVSTKWYYLVLNMWRDTDPHKPSQGSNEFGNTDKCRSSKSRTILCLLQDWCQKYANVEDENRYWGSHCPEELERKTVPKSESFTTERQGRLNQGGAVCRGRRRWFHYTITVIDDGTKAVLTSMLAFPSSSSESSSPLESWPDFGSGDGARTVKNCSQEGQSCRIGTMNFSEGEIEVLALEVFL